MGLQEGTTVPRGGLLCCLFYRCPVLPSTRAAGRSCELQTAPSLHISLHTMALFSLVPYLMACQCGPFRFIHDLSVSPPPQFSPGLHYPCSSVVTSHHHPSMVSLLLCVSFRAFAQSGSLPEPTSFVCSQGAFLFLRSQSMPPLNPFYPVFPVIDSYCEAKFSSEGTGVSESGWLCQGLECDRNVMWML